MTETVFKISKPFGPPLGLTEMPSKLITKINGFIDEEIDPKTAIDTSLDHGPKLAGQVNQEIKLPDKIIDGDLNNFFKALTTAYVKNAINRDVKNFKLI